MAKAKNKPTPKTPLTRKQKEMFDFVVEHIDQNGIAPTVQQAADAQGICLSNASRYISDLCSKQYLRRDPDKRYSLEVVED